MHAMTEIRGGATGSARLLGGEVLDVTDPWCAAAPNFQLPDSTQLFVAVSLQGLGMTFESSLAWAGFVAQWDTISYLLSLARGGGIVERHQQGHVEPRTDARERAPA